MQLILKLTIFSAFFLIICSSINAQGYFPFYYYYDNAGNRIGRSMLYVKPKSANIDSIESINLNKNKFVFQDSLDNLKVLIFPNPTHGELKIEFIGNLPIDGCTIHLYNMAGLEIINQYTTSNFSILDLSEKANGSYILCIVSRQKKSEWKIIKL